MKEIKVEEHLKAEVEKRGGMCLKLKDLGRRGHPDREVIWPWGEIDKVELKRPVGGRFEPGQKPYHEDLAKRGVPVYVLDTIEKVDTYVSGRSADFRFAMPLCHLYSVPFGRCPTMFDQGQFATQCKLQHRHDGPCQDE